MAIAAPLFYGTVIFVINLILFVFALLIEIVAFVNCLFQRSDAFSAINTLPKGVWLALTGGSLLVTLLFVQSLSVVGLLGLIAITVASVYLLDVRPALRDAAEGRGPW